MKKKTPVDRYRIAATDASRDNGVGFDELVVGEWFHMERMSTNHWWIGIGDRGFDVTLDRAGRPTLTEQ